MGNCVQTPSKKSATTTQERIPKTEQPVQIIDSLPKELTADNAPSRSQQVVQDDEISDLQDGNDSDEFLVVHDDDFDDKIDNKTNENHDQDKDKLAAEKCAIISYIMCTDVDSTVMQ